MSKFAGFIIGGLEVIAGVVLVATGVGGPLGVELIIQGSLMIVTQAVVDLTAPKTPAREASEMTLQLGEQPRSALFGETFTAGSLADGFDYGGKYGTDWEVLVIRLADHRCTSLTGFYVNDDWNPYVGDGLYPAYDDQLEVYFRANTTADPLPAIVTANGPGWTASDIGGSGCDVIVAYKADKENDKHPGWPGGRPRFGFVVKGKLCYDPRKDSTVTGGSGTHRWEDPATWEWSENAAVCRYNWARGIFANDAIDDPTALLVGRGLTAIEAPPENIAAPANLCDEAVGGGVRYRVAGPIYSNQEFIDVETMFAQATGGSIITVQGSVELEPGAAKSIVVSFTDDDLVSGSKASWNEGILSESSDEWINTVVASYAEPTQHWNSHDAPVVRSTSDIFIDGKPREATLTLRLVKDVGQAQRVAEIGRSLGRLWGRASVTLGPRFCQLEAGDWVQWTSARRFSGATKTFRVEANQVDNKWQNTLTLREISADVFGDSAVFQPDHSVATNTAPPPDIGSPAGGAWALAAVTLTNSGASVPALEITGACEDSYASAIIVEYWKSDGVIDPLVTPDTPDWVMEGSHAPSTTKIDITSITGGAVYYAAVTYVVSGILGDRRVLGPVTAGSLTTVPTSSLTASAPLTAGQIVNIFSSGGAAEVRPADVADDSKPADGFVLAGVASGATATVYARGATITDLSSLVPGAPYWLAASGALTAALPTSGWVQLIGKALSATTLRFDPQQGTLL